MKRYWLVEVGFFFFKQETALELSACLVGSGVCIRDSPRSVASGAFEVVEEPGCQASRFGRHPVGDPVGGVRETAQVVYGLSPIHL